MKIHEKSTPGGTKSTPRGIMEPPREDLDPPGVDLGASGEDLEPPGEDFDPSGVDFGASKGGFFIKNHSKGRSGSKKCDLFCKMLKCSKHCVLRVRMALRTI